MPHHDPVLGHPGARRRVQDHDLVRVGTMFRGWPGSPGCFPRGRPEDVRDDRFGAFVYGLSDNVG